MVYRLIGNIEQSSSQWLGGVIAMAATTPRLFSGLYSWCEAYTLYTDFRSLGSQAFNDKRVYSRTCVKGESTYQHILTKPSVYYNNIFTFSLVTAQLTRRTVNLAFHKGKKYFGMHSLPKTKVIWKIFLNLYKSTQKIIFYRTNKLSFEVFHTVDKSTLESISRHR